MRPVVLTRLMYNSLDHEVSSCPTSSSASSVRHRSLLRECRFSTQRRKSLALLAYLAVTQGSHARDTLATLLWPDLDQAHGHAVLRSALADLRRTIGHSALIATGDQIALGGGTDVNVDVVRFRELAAQVAAHHPASNALCDSVWTR